MESILIHNAGRAKALELTLDFSSVPTDQAVINGKEALSGVIWVILLYVWQYSLQRQACIFHIYFIVMNQG